MIHDQIDTIDALRAHYVAGSLPEGYEARRPVDHPTPFKPTRMIQFNPEKL
ncbi:hypothetical protein NMA58_07310 [Rhizobium sp. YTUHZ045]|uniref:hypothetical protein n=1 Tax=unclassified Rhizobium TaxID=2613769 RepID=UPI003D33AEBA